MRCTRAGELARWLESAREAELLELLSDLAREFDRRAMERQPVSYHGIREPVEAGPKLLTANEVAERLSLPKARVYALAREARIGGAVRIGRQIRFEPNALEEWIRQGGRAAAGSRGPEE